MFKRQAEGAVAEGIERAEDGVALGAAGFGVAIHAGKAQVFPQAHFQRPRLRLQRVALQLRRQARQPRLINRQRIAFSLPRLFAFSLPRLLADLLICRFFDFEWGRIRRLLVQRGEEPVAQGDGTVGAVGVVEREAELVAQEGATARVHRLADGLALRERGVERGEEALARRHQHTVLHRHDAPNPGLDEPGRDAGEGVVGVGVGGLAGIQHHQRDAGAGQQRAELLGVHQIGPAFGVLKNQIAHAGAPVVDAVPVKVDDVDGRGAPVGKPLIQRGERPHGQELHHRRIAQRLQRREERLAARARVNEGDALIFGAGDDHQHARGQGEVAGRRGLRLVQPPPETDIQH